MIRYTVGADNATATAPIFAELGCPTCQAVKFLEHVAACRCADCANGVPKSHATENNPDEPTRASAGSTQSK